MSWELWVGLGLSLVGGAMAGNSMLPMKFARRWKWENTWFVFSVLSLIVLPWALALSTIGSLAAVYSGVSAGQFAVPFLFGAGWGIAQVLFGLSVARLGLALAYAVIIGLGATLGTLVPLFFQRRQVLFTPKGTIILSGIALMLAGIVVSSLAGQQRERGASSLAARSYGPALVAAVICGLMAPMINFALAFGQDIANEAVRLGARQSAAAYAVWPIALFGGLIPNVAYAVYLLCHNHTWGNFRRGGIDFVLAGLMAVLWMGSMSVYGMSTAWLGALGTSVGWGLFQIFMVMMAGVSGMITGEWRAASRGALRTLWTGLCLLAATTALMSIGNR